MKSLRALPVLIVVCLLTQTGCVPSTEADPSDWPVYLGDPAASHYSSLDQINRQNVHRLKVAWTYATGDKSEYSQIQCNPLVVRGRLYATSPQLKAFCLDAATGEEIWVYDPVEEAGLSTLGVNRGLVHWGKRTRAEDLLYGRESPLRSGRRDRASGPLLWGRWPSRSEVRFGPRRPGEVLGRLHLAAGPVPGPPRRRQPGGGGSRCRRARSHPCLRRPDGPDPVDLPHDTAGRARRDTKPGRRTPGPTPAAPTPGRG